MKTFSDNVFVVVLFRSNSKASELKKSQAWQYIRLGGISRSADRGDKLKEERDGFAKCSNPWHTRDVSAGHGYRIKAADYFNLARQQGHELAQVALFGLIDDRLIFQHYEASLKTNSKS